jgi:putative endonuclease
MARDLGVTADARAPGRTTAGYRLTRLVWVEHHDDIRTAIQRERTMKHWPRAWKAELIEAMNPGWEDLFNCLA